MKKPKTKYSKGKGKVYLIGAGPGDPGLITVRGKEIIGRADIVLYDYLVNPVLLLHARDGAELVCVGKAPGRGGVSQAAINGRLVREARRGRVVARVKGGDPLLFGRGAEEALYLAREGVQFEIIPGVSASLAVPTCAGIPLTLRGVKSSVTIVTGHEASSKKAGGVDWDRLLMADSTFVVLMGVKNLEKIVTRFLSAGKNPRLPAALIEAGSTSRQKTVAGPLNRIARLGRENGINPPAILVVGETVALKNKLWRRRKLPLRGARVLVPRPLKQASHIARLLEERGAEAVVCPLVEIKPPGSFDRLDAAIRELNLYDWVIFTSANGVRAFMGRLDNLGLDSRALAPVNICSIGPATEAELARGGLKSDCRPGVFSSRGVVRALASRSRIRGRLFLLPRSDLASREIPEGIKAGGGRCVEVRAYRTVVSRGGVARARGIIRLKGIDLVLLTSPSIAGAYARVVKGIGVRLRQSPVCVCIGPVTAMAAKKLGLRVVVEADVHSDNGMIKAVEHYWRKRGKPAGSS